MNFEDILNKWEKNNGIYDKDMESENVRINPQERRTRLKNKKPDAQLDIHGLTRDEAWQALESFFNDSKGKDLEKILVIHGKGNHSKNEAVLKSIVMKFIEHCPFAGESGRGKAAAGGEGATWVILK
jgi:DNA-nicking Smr family endonuclease